MVQWLVNNSAYITMSGENANPAKVKWFAKTVEERNQQHDAAKEKNIWQC